MTKPKSNDKQLIEGALICINLIEQYLEDQTEDSLDKNFQVHDAVSYRMIILGRLISQVSHKITEKHDKFHWFISCFSHDESISVAWELYEANTTNPSFCESFRSIHKELENVYIQEFSPKNREFQNEAINDVDLKLCNKNFDDNYKYAIKTKNSIWTVKK